MLVGLQAYFIQFLYKLAGDRVAEHGASVGVVLEGPKGEADEMRQSDPSPGSLTNVFFWAHRCSLEKKALGVFLDKSVA